MDDLERFFLENPVSVNTEDRYRRALRVVLDGCDPRRLSALEFRQRLTRDGWGSSTTWVAFCAVRRFLTWRYGSKHPALALKLRRLESDPQRCLTEDQAVRLMALFDVRTPKGARDLAMAAIMLDAGLRCSEVCGLLLTGLDLQGRAFRVRAKGNQIRFGVFSVPTQMILDAWLSIRIGRDDTVFVSIGGNTPGKRLTRDGLGSTVRKWGKQIGIQLSPHDLRRSYATFSTYAGAPGRILQIATGWHDLKMVERYTGSITPAAMDPYFSVPWLLKL